MLKEEEDIVIEMEEGFLKQRGDDPKEYLKLIHDELAKPVTRESFYINVIVINNEYCWLNANSQIGRVLIFNSDDENSENKILKWWTGDFGEIVVVCKQYLDNSIEQLLELLKEHNFIS